MTNSHREFHQLWPNVLLLYQLFGFATYSQPASTRVQCMRRLLTTLCVAIVMTILSVYVMLMKLSFFVVNQVNVMSDESIYLTVLPAHLIALIESLFKYRQTERLFENVLAILLKLRIAHDEHIIDMFAIQRKILWLNWTQTIGLMAVMALSIFMTGIQSWIYIRWILLAQFLTGVRLIEVTMHVELLSGLMGALESLLLVDVDNDVNQQLIRLQRAAEIYGRIKGQAEAISAAFSWSVLAILLFALNAMINTSYLLVYTTMSGLLNKYYEL